MKYLKYKVSLHESRSFPGYDAVSLGKDLLTFVRGVLTPPLFGLLQPRYRLGRPRRRLEDNIKMDLQEIGCGGYGLDRAGSGYGQVAGTCECGNEPSGSIKCGEFLD